MQISEVSLAAIGGLRGLGLANGEVESRAAAAEAELDTAVSPDTSAPSLTLTPPTLGPSITSAATETGLLGRKLTLALSPKVVEAVKKPAAAVALARKVKASGGRVKVTPKAAKALVASAKKASPAVAAAVAQAVAPAVAAPTPAAAAAEKKAEAQTGTLTENPLKKLLRSPWVWAGLGVAVVGIVFIVMRRRGGASRAPQMQPQTPSEAAAAMQGLGRYVSLGPARALKKIRELVNDGPFNADTVSEVEEILDAVVIGGDKRDSKAGKKLTKLRRKLERTNYRGKGSAHAINLIAKTIS